MIKKFAAAFVLFFAACLVTFATLEAETVRERAENRFAMAGWSVNSEIPVPVERKSVALPGGNEAFPAMTPLGDAGLVSLYPELEGLGKLDYSEIDTSLLDLCAKVSDAFTSRKLEPSLCDPARTFIPSVTDFRMKKLPQVVSVRHSRPVVIASETGGQSSSATQFRLLFSAGKEASPEPLFVTVHAAQINGAWLVDDIVFDGKTYAKLAQQN